MSNNGIDHSLRNVKVGDEVVYFARHTGRATVARATKVNMTNGTFPRVSLVWLDNGTKWTGSGHQYGETGSFHRVYAYRISDRAAFDASQQRDVDRKRSERARRDMMDGVAALGQHHVTDDEVAEVNAILQAARARRAAQIFGTFAWHLARG